MNKYFSQCTSLEEAKKTYRNLSKNLHPDLGGDAEEFKAMKKEYENYVSNFMYAKFTAAGDKTGDNKMHTFQSILNKIIDFDIDIEIIGYWIYAKNSFAYKDELKTFGFWFSGKHKAWIFSGSEKKKKNSRLTVEQVKNLHGCESVKNKTVKKQIA